MAVFSLVIPVKTALVLQAFVAVFIIGWYAFRQRKHINFRLFVIPVCFSLAFTFIGLETAFLINEKLLKKCFGVILVLLSVSSLAGGNRFHLSKGWLSQAVAGSISGLLGGLTNMSGPPMAIYLIQVADSKEEYNGTLQGYFFIPALFKAIVHVAKGRLTMPMLHIFPFLLLSTVAGSLIGFGFFRKMNMAAVKKAVNILMIFTGLYYTFF